MSANTDTTPVANLLQEACTPVGLEAGTPVDTTVFEDFPDIFKALSDEVQTTNIWREADLANGEAAKRAMVTLGCGSCAVKEVCTVSSNLEQRAEIGPKLHMLAQAPRWLNAARISQSGVDERTFAAQMETDEAAAAAVESGQLDLDLLLGGVGNSLQEVTTKNHIPELKNFKAFDNETPLAAHDITTKQGDHFTVIDASGATNFKGPELNLSDYKILTGKILVRMNERDASGSPQILNPDQTMQKVLRNFDGGHVDEIRMTGKNRMYFTVLPSPEDQPDSKARIVILGGHAGTEADQQRFIDNVIDNR